MRILLDESVPKKFGFELAGHFVSTVQQVGWAGLKNGELLRKAKDRFDVLVTADQNIQYQQDLTMLPIPVVVLVAVNNRIETLRPLIPLLLAVLLRIKPGQLLHVGASQETPIK
jgi:predicted nuclease of predicted toxin-antitoxin system